MKLEEAIEYLENVEYGSEVEEMYHSLVELWHSYSSYVNDEFREALEKEIIAHAEYEVENAINSDIPAGPHFELTSIVNEEFKPVLEIMCDGKKLITIEQEVLKDVKVLYDRSHVSTTEAIQHIIDLLKIIK